MGATSAEALKFYIRWLNSLLQGKCPIAPLPLPLTIAWGLDPGRSVGSQFEHSPKFGAAASPLTGMPLPCDAPSECRPRAGSTESILLSATGFQFNPDAFNFFLSS
eukprot:3104396-Pyramimonas_sp.AAC.1